MTKQPLDRYQGGPRRIVAYPVFPLGSSRGVVDAPRRPPTPDASDDDDDDDDDDDEPVMEDDGDPYGGGPPGPSPALVPSDEES